MLSWNAIKSSIAKNSWNTEQLTNIQIWNKIFIRFFENFSWIVYTYFVILITVSVIYFILEWYRRLLLHRRRMEDLRLYARPPQKRRLSATARDHEIFRYIIREVNKYLNDKNDNRKFVCRITNDGNIYGGFITNDNDQEKELNSNVSNMTAT